MAADLQAHRAVQGSGVHALAIGITCALLLVIAAWQVPRAGWLTATALTFPLWMALAALLRHRAQPRTWPILCSIPYMCFGLMELIANPAARLWASACVLLGFALFASIAASLRLRR